MPKVPVYLLFPSQPQATVVWGSDRVREQLEWYQRRKEKFRGFFVKKLFRYAQDGFALWEGADKPIRPEWDQVFRIGHDSTQFRVVGFYSGAGNRAEFIACDAYLKDGPKLSASERARINAVATIRATGNWQRTQ